MAEAPKKEEAKDKAPQPAADAAPAEAAGGKKKKLILFGIIGLVVLGGGGAAAFFMLSGKSDHGAPADEHAAPAGEHGEEAKADGHGAAKDEHGKPAEKKDEHAAAPADGHGKEKPKADGHGAAKDEHGEKTEKPAAEADGEAHFGESYLFKPFHLNLGNPLDNHYVRLEIAVEYKGGEPQKLEIEKRLPQLRDAVVSVVGRKSREFLLGPDGKDQLRREILIRINRYMGKPVESVYITDILIE